MTLGLGLTHRCRGLDLQQIRTPTLRPLRYHTKQLSILEKGSRYQALIPSLRLYLSNNLLDDVPGEVYHLKNLEVLSLRSNNLTEILPSISALEDLHEVNFGSNQLKWLPWEFLHILQFQNWTKRTLHPNPFIRPIPSIWGMKIHRNRGRHSRGHIVSTHIAFLDISGASQRDYPPAPTSVAEHWAEPVDNEEVLRPPREERIRTPSLMELAIRACYKAPQLSQLPFLLPSNCPTHLRQLLESTWKLKEAGGRKCSVCSREYVIPRTEWIEWWYCIAEDEVPDISKSEVWHQGLTPLPFLRRGCSWQCFIEKPPDAPIRGWTSAAGPGGHPEELDLVEHS